MFTLRQLLKVVKRDCRTPIGHVRDMRTFAHDHTEWAGDCRDIVCDGCDILAQAKRWLGAQGIEYQPY
ncbi:hypothetical protein LCGC14_1245750 [marine sediment metagenome]|uniref:Uncharacterized protein n=1 Tax=marine sediment metagenome TaxID=412755 RepID=A0A0F9L8E7_9ZZZZ